MPGAVNAMAYLIDVCGSTTDSGSKFSLLGVVHLDDVTVNRHLPEVRPFVTSAKLRHLAFDKLVFVFRYAELNAYRASAVCHKITPSCAASHTTTDMDCKFLGAAKNFFEIACHYPTDNFYAKLGS